MGAGYGLGMFDSPTYKDDQARWIDTSCFFFQLLFTSVLAFSLLALALVPYLHV